METSSYPRIEITPWTPCPTRTLLPVYPPPEPLEPPALPLPPRQPSFDAPYTLSTHLFPAAYLRTTRYVPLPAPPPPTASKAERQKHLLATRDELKAVRGSTITDGYPQFLWNTTNRYVKKGLKADSAKGLTLFFAHANGFPKEIWEPVLAHLLSSPAGELVDEVWAWESVQHGDAALVNAGRLSALFDWTDNTRDILNFLLYYLPSRVSDAPLPTHLERLSAEETEHRRGNGFKARIFVPVGHSYGGCTSLLAAINHPKLFSSLVLVDPVLVKPFNTYEERLNDPHTDQLIMGSLLRRDTWSSREEALATFKKSPFFSMWDPAVLQVYVDCGIYFVHDAETGQQVARLKMPGIQEAVIFSETHTEYEAFEQFPRLDERIAVRWVVPGKAGTYEFGPDGSTHERVWLRPKNASNVRIHRAGHLIAQEAPLELANDICNFLLRQYSAKTSATAGIRANL